MPAGDIWQLSVDQTLFGVSLTNVHHFRQVDADTDPNMGTQLISAYAGAVEPSQVACQNPSLTIVQYRAIRIAPLPTQGVTVAAGIIGLRAGTSLAANVAALVTTKTNPIPKTRTGKVFLAGMNEADFIDGVWDSILRGLLEVFANALLAILIAPAGTSFEKVLWDSAASTAEKVLLREVKQAARKMRSRTKTS